MSSGGAAKRQEDPLTAGYYGDTDPDSGKAHGLGVRVFDDGRALQGQWQDGELHGLGRLEGPAHADDPRADRYSITGQWSQGQLHGVAVALFARGGGGYAGEYRMGVMHGIGMRTTPSLALQSKGTASNRAASSSASASASLSGAGAGIVSGGSEQRQEPCRYEDGDGPIVTVTLGDDKAEAARAWTEAAAAAARARTAAAEALAVARQAVRRALEDRQREEAEAVQTLIGEEMKQMAVQRCRARRQRIAEQREIDAMQAARLQAEADIIDGQGSLGGAYIAYARAGLDEREGTLFGEQLRAAPT